MVLKSSRLSLAIICFVCLSTTVVANNGLVWSVPTSDPLNARIEEGWNFTVLGGASLANGKSRTNLLGTDPWQAGWISKMPWLEFESSYAPNADWEFGVQIPLTIISTTINTYYRVSDFLKLGFKLGSISTLSATLSVNLAESWFVSLTPGFSLNNFGIPRKRTVNTAALLAPATYERLQQSRVILDGQIAIGKHMDPLDLAILFNYAYAPGEGLDNSFFFDDTFLHHFFRASVAAAF